MLYSLDLVVLLLLLSIIIYPYATDETQSNWYFFISCIQNIFPKGLTKIFLLEQTIK